VKKTCNQGCFTYYYNTIVSKRIFNRLYICDMWFTKQHCDRTSPVSSIPPVLHTHLHLNTIFIRGTSDRSLERSNKATVLVIGKHFTHKYWHTICIQMLS